MAWVRIDEKFARDPKVVRAGPLGIAMQVAALCYCNDHLTDGYVPTSVARTLLDLDDVYPGEPVEDPLDPGYVERGDRWRLVAAALVEAGMWIPAEGGWLIHDYHDYQPSREKILAERAAASDRRAKAKQQSADRRASVTRTSPDATANVNPPDPDPDTDTDKEKKTFSPETPVACGQLSDDVPQLTELLSARVQANGFKVPKPGSKTLHGWLDAIDKLLRIDHADPRDVAEVIEWATADEFWRANIRSAAKLRAQFPQLRLRMFNRRTDTRRRPQTPSEAVSNEIQALLAYANGQDPT